MRNLVIDATTPDYFGKQTALRSQNKTLHVRNDDQLVKQSDSGLIGLTTAILLVGTFGYIAITVVGGVFHV